MDVIVATPVADLARIVADVLAQDGHAVEIAVNGRAAVTSFLSALPDVAVLDVRLGDVTGLDVVRALRRCEGGADVTVVILAEDPLPVRAIGAGLGVRHVLPKPPSLLDLRELVAKAPPRRSTGPVIVQRPVMPVRRDRAPLPPPPPRSIPLETPSPELVQAVLRLRRELPRLQGADAWTVLGLARSASPELVRRAAERNRSRYSDLVRDGGGELAELAREMLRRVEAAVDEIGVGLAAAPDIDGVAEGLALLARSDWRAADRHFAALRDARPDSAAALAHLGWARFHNPALPKSVREPDAVALAELASAFDPWLADAWFYRAAMAQARGDLPAARALAERAARVDPTHAGAAGLLRGLPPRDR